MAIVSVGINLAKNVFAVHGVDEFGKPLLVLSNEPRAKPLERINLSNAFPDWHRGRLGYTPLGTKITQCGRATWLMAGH